VPGSGEGPHSYEASRGVYVKPAVRELVVSGPAGDDDAEENGEGSSGEDARAQLGEYERLHAHPAVYAQQQVAAGFRDGE
jgi:hypothetical protein